MTSKEYSKMASMRAKKSPSLKNCVWAFGIGGVLCAAAQVVILFAEAGGMEDKDARLFGSFLLIGFSVLLTALNVLFRVSLGRILLMAICCLKFKMFFKIAGFCASLF